MGDTSAPPELGAGRHRRDDRLAVALHGARAAVHDWVAGQDGDYAKTVRELERARSQGRRLEVRTRIVRSNARVLGDLPDLLRARGVSRWTVSFATAGDTSAIVGRIPRLTLALPPVLAAVDKARRRGVEVELRGLPLCLLGPFAALAKGEPVRAYAEPCTGCTLREGCPGVDTAYLERFGRDELRPASRRQPA